MAVGGGIGTERIEILTIDVVVQYKRGWGNA